MFFMRILTPPMIAHCAHCDGFPRVDSPEVAYEKKAWFVVNPQRSNWALRGHESTEIWSEKGVILVD